MKNFEELFSYTKEKKKHQIVKLKNRFYENPIDGFKKFLINEKGKGTVALNLNRLSTWYLWVFNNNFIEGSEIDYSNLAKSTYFSLECNNLEYFLGNIVETYDDATSFTESIKHLGQMLYLGWGNKAIQYGQLLIKMLNGKQYKGWNSAYIHPWFMFELYCKWQNINIDKTKLNYPEDLMVYKKSLAHWDTFDVNLLSSIIDELTEFHIQQSDEYEIEIDNEESKDLDFTSADYFIFPVEILMWLAIRRLMGLPEYKPSEKNQLMQLEINKLPDSVIPYPQIELVELCKKKLLADNPGITFEL